MSTTCYIENKRCKKEKKKCIKQCTKADFKKVQRISNNIDRALNRLTVDPVGSTKDFASNFAPGGLFSISFNPVSGHYLSPSNVYGATNIYNFFLGYAQNPGEINQTVTTRNLIWDCLKRTLVVERDWFANLTASRNFVYGPTGPLITLPSGASYEQDDAIVYQFDCDYKLVYNREYFDTTQFVSTFTNNYPPVCKIKCCQESKHESENSESHKACTTNCEIPPCTDCDRDRATQVWNELNFAINLSSYDPVLSTDLFVSHFADCGVWSTSINPSTYPYSLPLPQANIQGISQIRNFLLSYELNPGETNQTVTDQQIYWDCNNRTLAVERLWTATLTAPRTFGSGTGDAPPPTTLGTGTTYQQDDLVVVRFDCDFKIVFYREYFDNAQYQSTYRKFISPVCSETCDCESCEKCFKNTHKPCKKRNCPSGCGGCNNNMCAPSNYKSRSVKCYKCDRCRSNPCSCRK